MKKNICLLLSILIIQISIFAKDLDGFWGIPFGTSRASAVTTMRSKGWKINSETSNKIVFIGGTYAGSTPKEIKFFIYDNKLCAVDVNYQGSNAGSNIERLATAVIEKYELIKDFDTQGVFFNELKYHDEQGNFIRGLYNNNSRQLCTLNFSWYKQKQYQLIDKENTTKKQNEALNNDI